MVMDASISLHSIGKDKHADKNYPIQYTSETRHHHKQNDRY